MGSTLSNGTNMTKLYIQENDPDMSKYMTQEIMNRYEINNISDIMTKYGADIESIKVLMGKSGYLLFFAPGTYEFNDSLCNIDKLIMVGLGNVTINVNNKFVNKSEYFECSNIKFKFPNDNYAGLSLLNAKQASIADCQFIGNKKYSSLCFGNKVCNIDLSSNIFESVLVKVDPLPSKHINNITMTGAKNNIQIGGNSYVGNITMKSSRNNIIGTSKGSTESNAGYTKVKSNRFSSCVVNINRNAILTSNDTNGSTVSVGTSANSELYDSLE